jgi:hypothetical protein
MSFRTGLRSEESLLGFVFSLAAVFTSGAPRNRCHHTIPESILDIAINKAHNPAQEEVLSNEHTLAISLLHHFIGRGGFTPPPGITALLSRSNSSGINTYDLTENKRLRSL